ncbi:AAA family ATPase [Patescibacteria group bacterium]|nr:AAA family ATPase [Patescibacteria group bacterium]MBU1934605.1 AAA family ATPase [Patescibacteria group bacterium]
MIIKYLTIRNFRGIDNLENLEISNLNTFVGKNDAGKSVILRALACFFDIKKFDAKDVFKGKLEDEITSIEISFLPSVEIDDLALDSKKLITIKKEFSIVNGKPKPSEYYLCNDFTDKKYQDLWNKKEQDLNQIVADLGEEPNKSGRGKKNILRIEQIKTILSDKEREDVYNELGDFMKNIEKTYEIALPEYSLFDAEQDLNIEATNFQLQFKPIISAYFETTKDKTAEIEKGLKADLATEFEEIRKYMTKNVSGLKKLNPSTEFDWSKSLKKFDLNLEFEGQNFDVPISHKGTGFKRLLMVAYFEYLASKKSIRNQIFAIEEPETYLHPSAQQDLLNSIVRISEDSQFFLTTHSPVFAGATDGKNSILVTKDEHGISHYSREEQDIIEQIISELGIRPDYNLLKEIKYLIFVEGKDDIHFLNSYAKTVLDKELENDKILCVIGGGGSLKNYADLDLFKKLKGNNFYSVMVDGDDKTNGKEKWCERIKAKCESDSADFKKLSKREIENYCHPQAICRKCPNLTISSITIDKDTDVPKHLKELGLIKNFKNDLNIEVFNEMTKDEWEEIDTSEEIKQFIESIYTKIQ